jgi:hypothetical protein
MRAALLAVLVGAVSLAATPGARANHPAAPVPLPAHEQQSILYGPYTVPPKWAGGVHLAVGPVTPLCNGCTLTSMTADLVDAAGRSVNVREGVMLHHVVFSQYSVQDATCGRSGAGGFGDRFFAAGNERTKITFPPGFGYPIASGPWNIILELTNSGQVPQPLFVKFTATVAPAAVAQQLKPVRSLWLDWNNCGNSERPAPPGLSEHTWRWTSGLTGRIVSAGGHVHDGGTSITLRNATTDHDMCQSVAGYLEDPAFGKSVSSMSICVHDRLGTVRAGEQLEIVTRYNRRYAHEPDPHAMGIMLTYLHPTDDLTGGTQYEYEPADEPIPPEAPHDH